MLMIRDEQLGVFEAAARQAFEHRMVLRLVHDAPAPRDESAARDLVRLAVRKCLGYGIDMVADIQQFLRLMVTHSPDFETRPEMAWALALLERPDLPGTAKTKILLKRLGDPASPPPPPPRAASA
jgi:hypothetical protein